MDNRQVAQAFVDAINAHDVGRIAALMAPDHVFVDAYDTVQPREAMKEGWPGYFDWFPDYLIEVDEMLSEGDTVCIFGHAGGTFRGRVRPDGAGRWRLPAAWRVVVADGKVRVWQVFADSKIPYEAMEVEEA